MKHSGQTPYSFAVYLFECTWGHPLPWAVLFQLFLPKTCDMHEVWQLMIMQLYSELRWLTDPMKTLIIKLFKLCALAVIM